jgi:hypothetical protein
MRIVDRLAGVRVGFRAPRSWPAERLGLLERWYAAQPVPRVAGCIIELDAPLGDGAVLTALEQLRRRHPAALDVTLAAGKFRPCVSPMLPVAHATSADVWTLAEADLLQPFPEGGRLWRVSVASELRALVVTFHHVIADGLSVCVFVREFLSALRGERLSPEPEPRLPLEARADVRPSLRRLVAEASAGKAPSFFAGPEELGVAFRTRLRRLELSAPLVQALAARARSEGATVHAALCAAGLAAVAIVHDGLPLNARLVSPISLRARLSPVPEGMGNFIGGLDTDHRLVSGEPFWSFAARYTKQLRDAATTLDEQAGLLRFAGDLTAFAKKIAASHPNGRTATFEVSNDGRVEGIAGAKVWFLQGNHYHGPLYNLTVGTCASTNVLRATLAVPEPLVADADAGRFLQALKSNLERAMAENVTFGDLAGA